MRTNQRTMRVAGAAAASLLAVGALAAAGTGGAATPKLVGTVGPGDTITLKTAAGKRVTTLKAGTYAIAVRDRARDHNFHLRGRGINRALSSVPFVGTRTVTVRLRAGVYTFVCQPHADDMRGSFRVR